GADGSNQELAALAADADLASSDISLLGERADVAELTAAFDIACSASRSEGFPNVVGEAMACGVPCVATDVGDSSYIIGDTGKMVPPNDPAALSQAIGELAELGLAGRTALGLAARERILRKFSLPSVVERYEELYEAALSRLS